MLDRKYIVLACGIMPMLSLYAQTSQSGLDAIGQRMTLVNNAKGTALYEVYIPSSSEPVVYDIRMSSSVSENDTLCPVDYLIDWTLHHDSNESKGFSAYYSGNHYRFRNNRLNEYHYVADPVPFNIGRYKGVQMTAQFVDLLPQIIGKKLSDMVSDSTYVYKITNSTDHSVRIEGVRRVKGYDALEYTYVVDTVSALPISVDIVYNPAQISEQTMSVRFKWDAGGFVEVNERELLRLYPEVFDKFRTDNFRVDKLPGTLLPGFSLPTSTRERYSRNRGDNFKAPTLLAFMDQKSGMPETIVAKIRKAVGQLPFMTDVIYIFGDNDTDGAESVVGQILPGEYILMSGRSLFRDLGVTDSPTLVFCSPDKATISSVHIGDSADLNDIITQNLILAGQK